MNKKNFLSTASDSNAFISEGKIITTLNELGKAIIISMKDLTCFTENIVQVIKTVENIAKSQLWHIEVSATGVFRVTDLGDRDISETEMFNLLMEMFREHLGYCFAVNSGIQCLLVNGKLDSSINNCLAKTKSMQEQLKMLEPVSNIKKVFEQFRVETIYEKEYYNICFNERGKVKPEIREQELRNILMKYLGKHMKGEVSPEFCTDFHNDEESVDIYINDGKKRAIIEVKFSLQKEYYDGKTHYDLVKRVEDGIKQLDKYALHLAKDARLVDYGYVFVFYMSKFEFEKICSQIKEKVVEMDKVISSELRTIFCGVEKNDMKLWGTNAKL